VHYKTFDGLNYDLQAVGEFVIATATSGPAFTLQGRAVAVSEYASALNEIGLRLGSHRVTFDATRDPHYDIPAEGRAISIDGVVTPMRVGDVISLDGGTIRRIDLYTNEITTRDGDVVTAHLAAYNTMSVSFAPAETRAAGTIAGLLGNLDGSRDNEFSLRDGTSLGRAPTPEVLLTTYADSWRIAQSESLLDYKPGETTDTFTVRPFPAAPVSINSFPTDVVESARALATAAGITDPTLRDNAALDYLLTGDRSFIEGAKRGLDAGVVTVPVEKAPDAPAATANLIGIAPVAASLVESNGATTPVQFRIFRTGDASSAVTVTYALAPDPNGRTYTGADFGGSAPTGTVTLAAGETSTTVTIAAPDIVGVTDKSLGLSITAPSGYGLAAGTARSIVANADPIAGTPAGAGLLKVSGAGTFGATGATSYSLDLGTLAVGAAFGPVTIGVVNTGGTGANTLSGAFDSFGTGVDFTSTALYRLGGGSLAETLTLSADTSAAGSFSETIVLHPTQSNASGYSGALADVTLTVTFTVSAVPTSEANKPVFGTTVTDASGPAGQVYELYEGLLGRAPDPLGYAHWLDALAHGQSLVAVARDILGSGEYIAAHGRPAAPTDADFVNELYGTVLGRTADEDGRAHWLDALSHGLSRPEAAFAFALSAENIAQDAPALAKGVFAPDPVVSEVARLYYGLLDRAPDRDGLLLWSQEIKDGHLSEAGVARAILAAPEYAAHFGAPTDNAFLTSLYDGALGRTPDADGLRHWQDALGHGASRAEIALSIANSLEAQLHHVSNIEQGWHLVA